MGISPFLDEISFWNFFETFLRHWFTSFYFAWLNLCTSFEILCAGLNFETSDLLTFWLVRVSFWDLLVLLFSETHSTILPCIYINLVLMENEGPISPLTEYKNESQVWEFEYLNIWHLISIHWLSSIIPIFWFISICLAEVMILCIDVPGKIRVICQNQSSFAIFFLPTQLWSPLTWWVRLLFLNWAKAQQSQKSINWAN